MSSKKWQASPFVGWRVQYQSSERVLDHRGIVFVVTVIAGAVLLRLPRKN